MSHFDLSASRLLVGGRLTFAILNLSRWDAAVLKVYAAPANNPDAPQRWEKISLMLIESISALDAAPVSPTAQ